MKGGDKNNTDCPRECREVIKFATVVSCPCPVGFKSESVTLELHKCPCGLLRIRSELLGVEGRNISYLYLSEFS